VLDSVKETVSILALVAGLAALVLFLLAASAAVVASYRVGFKRRPLILTFGGSDDSRAALTALFAMQLKQIEKEWTGLAGAVKTAREEYDEAFEAAPKVTELPEGDTPLADGAQLPPMTREGPEAGKQAGIAGVGVGPRSVGDETVEYVMELTDGNSLSDLDVGTVTVGGISFSPQAMLALLRLLPNACARRRISGTLAQFGETAIIAATYEERAWRGPSSSAHRIVAVEGDWLAAINALAFRLNKGRVEVIRSRRKPTSQGSREAALSETAERGFIEAESWEASKAFLAAYQRHFKHFVSGTAADRDAAIELYTTGIAHQPGYTRALYNRGTLLYNRYGQGENDRAINDFQEATRSEDRRLRALAFAGLAMAYGQQVHRFGVDKHEVAAKASDASTQALELDRTLEESWFARGWALQIEERWAEAVEAYDDVAKLPAGFPPGRRIQSFAHNNIGWITMNKLNGDLRDAERRFWQALALYPNKIAYVNLADVAKRHGRYELAATLFQYAVGLDPSYINGWHEYALLELERGSRPGEDAEEHLERACELEATAERVAGIDDRERIRKAFEQAAEPVAATV